LALRCLLIEIERRTWKSNARMPEEVLERTDIALLVTEADTWGEYEQRWCTEFQRRQMPALVVLNKIDTIEGLRVSTRTQEIGLPWCTMSAAQRVGVLETKQSIIRTVPDDWYKQAGILDGIFVTFWIREYVRLSRTKPTSRTQLRRSKQGPVS